MSAREWDAATYHRVAGPQETWGRAVLERLPLRGDETVLDAGCGSGRVTALLADRLPRGRVIGVDASASMVEQARAHLGDRATILQADLTELALDDPVDAILSTATFHWITDHQTLFARLFAVLRPGGRLVAQCGGRGNLAGVLAVVDEVSADPAFAAAFAGWVRPTRFASAEETAATLAAAGFVDIECGLQPWPVVPDEPVAFLRTVILRTHLERLPAEQRDDFVARVAERLPEPVTLDYVRLNIAARRPHGG
ncbi:MAG TPA: methyltransferase domain-containing protein [Egibacteraceae bacterium]|nr:methyltransferase domain-containing protein [Egibacteraceae bacterium]